MVKMQKLDLLIALYIFCIAVSELMGAKTFPLVKILGYQLNASVAIFVLPLLFTINDVVTEVLGKERARSIIQSGMVVIALILGFSLLATNLPPSMRFSSSEGAYDEIFLKSARISAASLIAFAIAGFLDVYVFARLRARLGKKALWFRNNVSNIVSQLADTTLFITLAFYAIDKSFGSNATFLVSLIIPYWLLKCSVSALETPLVYFGVKWLKEDKK